MKILLIAGHGAGDPGATGNGYQEAVLTREVVSALEPLLSEYAEVDVFDTNKKLSNYLIYNSFNFKPYDYVLEIHFNAIKRETISDGKTKGTEVLVHTSESVVTVEQNIANNIAALGFTNRGVKKRNNLIVMNTCKGKQGISYALVEVCFIDDIDDMRLYQNKKNDVVKAIANGVIQGFKLNKTKKVKTLESADEIARELNRAYFPITELNNFIKILDEAKRENSPLYWGYYKLVNKIRE
jgi:N-acetylmuramoyl-L-alanine amidase